MNKYAVLAVIAVSCLALAQAENRFEKPGYKLNYSPRLGHFAERPFVNLYKNYAFAFNREKSEKGDLDDLENFRPTAADCLLFFTEFKAGNYELKDLEFMVPLDACLGYIYDTDFENDKDVDAETIKHLKAIKKMEYYENLYKTRIEELSPADKTCVGDLLLKSIQAKVQFPDTDCNNHYLQLYIQFAECQNTTAHPESELFSLKDDDNYVKMVYDLVKSRTKECYAEEIDHLNMQMRDDKYHEWSTYKIWKSTAEKQAKRRNWSKPVYELLLAVENKTLDHEISVRDAGQITFAFGRGDEIYQNKLLEHIAYYATKKIKPRKTNKSHKKTHPAFGDAKGESRYVRAIDKLCKTFRSSDREQEYDFATSLIRVVQLLEYPSVLGITEDEFLQTMLVESEENGALYVCVSACNILSFTFGTLDETKLNYIVTMKPDTSGLPAWPVPLWI